MPARTRIAALLTVATLTLTSMPATGAAVAASPKPTVTHLTTNSLTDPLGVSGQPPLLSWQLDAPRRNVTQQRYQVRVTQDGAVVWDSGEVRSDQSLDVRYAGPALTAYTRYLWTVRIWDDSGTASAWSPQASFETGPLAPSDWTGDWIGADDAPGPEWADYTVDLDFTLRKEAFGVFLRGRGGLGYMWQLNNAQGRALFRPHVRNPGGGYTVLAEVPLDTDLTQRHNLRITVAGTTLTTYLDDREIDRRDRTDHTAPGLMGFRTDGNEEAVVHDLKVTSASGQVLVDTAFPAGDGTFPDGEVLPAGGLRLHGGDLWLPGKAAPLFRKDISLPSAKKVRSARIHASAQGVYELRVNGTKAGDHELAPGWTDYRTRIQSQSYDVTALLEPGANTLGAELTNGWFAGNVAMFGPNKYGTSTGLVAQLRITYDDGSTEVVGTDSSWRTTPGPVRTADLLNGETYDARLALPGWDRPGYDAASWQPVVTRPSATAKLVPQTDQPVRITQRLQAKAIPSPTPGAYLYDLGQNMVGTAELTLTGAPGRTARIRYGEVLNPDGTLYTANLRGARATDHYTFATSGPETYRPRFTFHGFRYVEISGATAGSVTGVVMGTDGPRTSTFRTSSALVNQLHSNIVWGQRGNFLSIPTDTPARDERMGWTGDINVFARTAVYNLDSQAFLAKWLRDLRDAQRADGAYPSVAPVVPGAFDGGFGNTGWADAGINVPWTLWQAYGDLQVVRDSYASMTRYLDYLVATSDGLVRGGGDYGDWLNLDDPTPGTVIGTAFLAKGARQLSQMAAAIGRSSDASRFAELYDEVRAVFASKFVTADGTVSGDSQTAYILALTSDLVPADRIDAAGKHFANTIARRGNYLSTGFLGVDGLLPVLTKIGRTDLAYTLLQNTDYPSWGYEIGWGATTVWERWNSINPDGTFNDVGMNSFNHYAYGAAGEWMYRTLAGVSAAEPGYHRSLVAPVPGPGITFADFGLQTRYGTVGSHWQRTAGGGLTLDVTVPGNTTATVRIPAANPQAVTESGEALPTTGVTDDGDTVSMTVGSGRYHLVVDPARSALGDTLAAIASLDRTADTLASAGRISAAEHRHLTEQAEDLAHETQRALDRRRPGRDPGSAANRSAVALQLALDLRDWIGDRADSGVRAELAQGNEAVITPLTEAIRLLTGLTVTVAVAAGDHLPGDTVAATVTVANAATQARPGTTAAMHAPAGWTVDTLDGPATVPAGGRKDFRFEVTVPAGAPVASAALDATVGFDVSGTPVHLPVTGTLAVASPVQLTAVEAVPASGEPGSRTTVTARLHNRSGTAVTGRLTMSVPEGWTAPAPSDPVTVGAGADGTVVLQAGVPLEVSAAPATLTARFGDGRGELVSAPVAFEVTESLTPPGAIDYADLGDSTSETAHGLTAGPSSGTSVEAGRTRRYSGMFVPGSWFEFDLGIRSGSPFLLRLVETYDGPQVKNYQVLVNGTALEHRVRQRTAAGLEVYQLLVDDPALLSGPKARIRVQFNDTATGYDPSIADAWSLPLP